MDNRRNDKHKRRLQSTPRMSHSEFVYDTRSIPKKTVKPPSAKQVVAMRLRERMDRQCRRKHMARWTRVSTSPSPNNTIDDVQGLLLPLYLLKFNAHNFRGGVATKKSMYSNTKTFMIARARFCTGAKSRVTNTPVSNDDVIS